MVTEERLLLCAPQIRSVFLEIPTWTWLMQQLSEDDSFLPSVDLAADRLPLFSVDSSVSVIGPSKHGFSSV